ncbi:MAG: hypothetical protein AB1601_16310 [Planctomycetota bacterium]
MQLRFAVLVLGVLSAGPSTTLAHRPILSDGSARDAATALHIADPGLSQVVYHEVTGAAPQLWLAFDFDAGQSLHFQLGVPVIERLEGYRPALALVGPGLPAADLPLPIPEGLGAREYTVDPAEIREFHEPFSGTSSWILMTHTVPIATAGRYYLVAYDPAGRPGKLWVAVGRREEFGLNDIVTLPEILTRVREFHETEAARPGLPCFLAPMAMSLVGLYAWSAVRRRATGHDTPGRAGRL